MSKKPVFISGIGRSGTRAVLTSIGEHSDVIIPNRLG